MLYTKSRCLIYELEVKKCQKIEKQFVKFVLTVSSHFGYRKNWLCELDRNIAVKGNHYGRRINSRISFLRGLFGESVA